MHLPDDLRRLVKYLNCIITQDQLRNVQVSHRQINVLLQLLSHSTHVSFCPWFISPSKMTVTTAHFTDTGQMQHVRFILTCTLSKQCISLRLISILGGGKIGQAS